MNPENCTYCSEEYNKVEEANFYCIDCEYYLCNDHDEEFHSAENTYSHNRIGKEKFDILDGKIDTSTNEIPDNDESLFVFNRFVQPGCDAEPKILEFGNMYDEIAKINDVVSVINFIGPTGGGKSKLIDLLGTTGNRPQVAPLSSLVATTTHVRAYFGQRNIVSPTGHLNVLDADVNNTFQSIYLDSRGCGSRSLDRKGSLDKSDFDNLLTSKIYPGMLYSTANIICFPTLDDITTVGRYVNDLLRLTRESPLSSSSKPELILIFNKLPFAQIDHDSDFHTFQENTRSWRQHYPNEYNSLMEGFSRIWIVSFPNYHDHAISAAHCWKKLSALIQYLSSLPHCQQSSSTFLSNVKSIVDKFSSQHM